MSNNSEQMALVEESGRLFIQALRTALNDNEAAGLEKTLSEAQSFIQAAEGADQSLPLLAKKIELLLASCSGEGILPNALEKEALTLAADWLEQLILLYSEGLPGPKALVQELLYTFDLVERSHEVVALSDLLEQNEGREDIFSQDPELSIDQYEQPKPLDPFEGDPGFGMEFDLLQRTLTLNRAGGGAQKDIFTDDDMLGSGNTPAGASGSVDKGDIFADDPSLEDE